MRSNFSYFLMLFLLFSLVFICEKPVNAQNIEYQGWIYNTKYIIINDVTYKILISEGGHSILLKSDIESTSLDINSCEETSYKRYCFNYSEFDKDEQDYKAFLYVYSIQPAITLTRTLTDNILQVGDTSEFKATISNTGEYDAADVSFIEEFPENIEIESVKEGIIVNNSVMWQGEIKKGEAVEIKYKIKSMGEADKYQKAYVKYFDGISDKEIISTSIRLYSPKTLNIEMTTDKEDYEINEEIILDIGLANDGIDDIKINSLHISIPESMQLMEYDSDILSKKSENQLFYEDTLNENDSVNFELTLSGKKEGMFFAVVSGDYDYKGNNYKIQNEKVGYLIHSEGIEIFSSLDAVEYVNSNQMLVILARLKNKNSFTKITNVQMLTQSDISTFNKGSYSSIDINQTVILLNTEIKIPDETSEKVYPIYFNVTYALENGQVLSEVLERKIVVRPSELIKILPAISSYNVLEDEPITVSVSLQNPKVTSFKEVFVKATVPKEFKISGPTSAFSALEASKESKIISFVITPNRVEKITTYNLNFSVSYVEDEKEYKVSSEKSIVVSPRTPKISFQKTINENDVYVGEIMGVSYQITNEDSVPVHDLVLITAKSKPYDMLNLFEKKFEKINQLETITFNGEQIRAKKIGNQYSGMAILFFKDIYERVFNVTSNNILLNVKDAEIDGPAIIIDKNVKDVVQVGENIVLSINITNVGQDRAIGNLSDENIELILPFYSNKFIQKNISFEKEGIYIIPRSVFTYSYGPDIARAYSDEITIDVRNSSIISNANNAIQPEESNKENQEKNAAEDNSQNQGIKQKESIFRKIYNWLRNLFIKS